MTDITRFDGMETQPNPDVVGSRWEKNVVFGPGNSYEESRPGTFQVTTTLQPGTDGTDGGSFKYAVYSLKDDDFGHVIVYAGIGRVGYGPQAGGLFPVPLVPASVTAAAIPIATFLFGSVDINFVEPSQFERYDSSAETFASTTAVAATDIIYICCVDVGGTQWVAVFDTATANWGWEIYPSTAGVIGSVATFASGDGGATLTDYVTEWDGWWGTGTPELIQGFLGKSSGTGFYLSTPVSNANFINPVDAQDTFLCIVDVTGTAFTINRVNNATDPIRTANFVDTTNTDPWFVWCAGMTYAPDGDIVIHVLRRQNATPLPGQMTRSHYILKINPDDWTVRTNYPAQLSADPEYTMVHGSSDTYGTLTGCKSLQLGPDDYIYGVFGYTDQTPPTDDWAGARLCKFKVGASGVTDFTELDELSTGFALGFVSVPWNSTLAVNSSGNAVIVVMSYDDAFDFVVGYWNGTTISRIIEQNPGFSCYWGSGVYLTADGGFAVTGYYYTDPPGGTDDYHEAIQFVNADGTLGDLVIDPTLPSPTWQQSCGAHTSNTVNGGTTWGTTQACNFDPMGWWLSNAINRYGV